MRNLLQRAAIIKVPTSDGIVYINTKDIIRVQAISNYSKLFFTKTANGTKSTKTLVVAKVLRWFEEKLADEGFVRIHRTHIINKLFISTYSNEAIRPSRGGKVHLSNGECIEVSKRKKTCFLQSWCQPAA
jgi:two-component system, LytTR family, response regulator